MCLKREFCAQSRGRILSFFAPSICKSEKEGYVVRAWLDISVASSPSSSEEEMLSADEGSLVAVRIATATANALGEKEGGRKDPRWWRQDHRTLQVAAFPLIFLIKTFFSGLLLIS